MSRTPFSKRALLDIVVIAVALVAANWLIARGDFGWKNLNPSPYLLLPLLVGTRFGFAPGLLSGSLAALLVLLLRANGNPELIRQVWEADRYLIYSLLAIGAICGELGHYFLRSQERTARLSSNLSDRLRITDAENRYLRESKDELDRALATRDGEVSTLDSELRRLYSVPRNDLAPSILLLVNRQARVSDAAIYLRGPAGLSRIALLGSERDLPADLQLAELTMARLAWQQKTLVTLPQVLDGARTDRLAHLVAVPMMDAKDEPFALLLVSGMPFTALNTRTIELLNLITKWAGEILDLQLHAEGKYRLVSGAENQKIFTSAFFDHVVQLAAESLRDYNIPSTLLFFFVAEGMEQAEFEYYLLRTLRTGDYACTMDLPFPHLVILLPMTGERGGTICRDRILQHWNENVPDWPLPQVQNFPHLSCAEIRDTFQSLRPPEPAPL